MKSQRFPIWKRFSYWVRDWGRDLVWDRAKGPLTICRINRHLARGIKELEAGFALAERFNANMLPALVGRLWRYGLRGQELSERASEALDRARELKIKLHGKLRQKRAKRGEALAGVRERKTDKKK